MKPLVLLSFSLAFLTQGFADSNSQMRNKRSPESSMSMKSKESEWCLSPYHEAHASIRHNEANGIGYKDGYTTLEVFGIYDGYGSDFMPFVDFRGHVFNDGKLAGNLGIGERTLFESINHTFGSYLYYDLRRVGHGLTVNQLSPGLELVGERMEYRINGYFPVGKHEGHKYGFRFDKFSGNSIILKGKQQQAMTGFDAEVGAHLPQSTRYDLYAGAGPYYFKSSHSHAWGGKVRLLGRYKEYVTLEVNYSYDKLFHNVVQGSLAFTLPFGRKLQRCGRCCPQTDNLLLSRAAFAPSRLEIPVVKRVRKREKAINPATGQPWIVWFVDNTSHSAGTFESPFPTLLEAQNASSPDQMIYVFPGDGTTNGMNAGITLQDGQTFFGSGINQQFATTKGTKTIPAMSSSNPSITNAVGNAVTIGNNNTISGFNISYTGTHIGITSPLTNLGVESGTIINNAFASTGLGGFAVYVYGSGGTFNISNNNLTQLSPHGIGIIIAPVGGTITGQISNNIFSNVQQGIILSSVVNETIGPGFSNYDNFTVQGNRTNLNGGTSLLVVLPQTSSVNIIENSIAISPNAGNTALKVQDDSSSTSITANIISNKIDMLTGNAFGIQISCDTARSSTHATVINNSVINNGGSNASYNFISFAAHNTMCLTFDNNISINSPPEIAFNFVTVNGVINIDSIQGNIGGPVMTSGTSNVHLVLPGTCGD